MVIDIKMCRFEDVPWGFRLVGGSDFEYPLTVVKVTEGSIAEEAGMLEGDVIVRINDTPTSPLTHDETNHIIKHCGNVFIIGVQREAEQLENAPKHFPILGVERPSTPLGFVSVPRQSPITLQSEDKVADVEYLPELPERPSSVLSEASEIKLVEEEIAAVLSGESEVLKEHDIMGIFPKPGVCMSSDVLRTLNEEAIKTKAEKDKENKKWSTFLQRPDRPIPKSKEQLEAERRAANAYKVNIVKSAPRSRSVSPMPRPPEPVPPSEPETPAAELEKQLTPPKPEEVEEDELPPTDSEVPNLLDVKAVVEPPIVQKEGAQVAGAAQDETAEKAETIQPEVPNDNDEEKRDEQEKRNKAEIEDSTVEEQPSADTVDNSAATEVNVEAQRDKTAEELALEQQLSDVQRQLAALSSLPSTIQATLDAVTKQLAELVPAFKLQQTQPTVKAETVAEARAINLEQITETAEQSEQQTTTEAEAAPTESRESAERNAIEAELAALDDNKRQEAQQEMRELEEEQCVKKQKRHDVIEELEEQLEERRDIAKKRSKRAFGPLTPSSERPLVLPGGRRWYRPKDAYNDEFIAETLSAQAELITGTTLGVNFMKYQKPERKIDLNRSEVYKVIHHLDRQPVRGIEVRPPVVPAEVDIRKVAVQP